jgi:hypothetical protein
MGSARPGLFLVSKPNKLRKAGPHFPSKNLPRFGGAFWNNPVPSAFSTQRVISMMNQIFWSFYTVTVLGSVTALILITFM